MKLNPHTYKAWWDLHAWSGVVVSLIAYVMFFFGTITLFHVELAIWQEPPRGPVPTNDEVDRIIDAGIAEGKIDRETMRLNFPRPSSPSFSLSYQDARGEGHSAHVERTGLVEPRSNVADFLYGMHYLQFPSAPPWLYTLAGLASGLLLLALVSGVLIHLRDLVAQFHQFRARKGLQVVWSDAHKVLGTISLPFAAVYAFTGAWMGLASFINPQLATAGFHGDEQAARAALYGGDAPIVAPAHIAASRLSLTELRAIAEQAPRAPGSKPKQSGDCRSVFLNHLGDLEATALFYCADNSLVFRQRDGSPVASASPPAPPLFQRLAEVPNAMHFIEFAQLPMRALYALLGLTGAAAILTGNWLWLERRAPSWGNWALQRLTLMVGVGAPLASVGLLLANRFAVPAAGERHSFWWTWLAVCVVSVLGKDARLHWCALLAATALGLCLVPLVGFFTHDAAFDPWRNRLVERSVDVSLFALGVSLAWLAWSLRGWQHRGRPTKPARSTSLGDARVA